MKNIHILPTDKPSRLGYLTKKGKEVFNDLRLFEKPMPNILDSENQNIYITSDEEIKEGDWVYCLTENRLLVSNVSYSKLDDRFKIILTTDQDLINDGIQAIDNEFLEWFVKNPNCESVEVKPLLSNNGRALFGYKIIILQEKPKFVTVNIESATGEDLGKVSYIPLLNVDYTLKQETLEEEIECSNCGNLMSLLHDNSVYACFNHECTSCYEEEPKQETIEEAGVAYAKTVNQNHTSHMLGFYNGAKWMQERMYSEEDVRTAIFKSFLLGYDKVYSNELEDIIIEQFKKEEKQ